MGQPKQLMEFQGKPLIRHAAETALASVCRPVVVVLGAFAEGIAPALAGLPVELVYNRNWELGIGTSIHAGIEAVAKHDVQGAILCLADQPLISAAIYNCLVATHATAGRDIVTSEYSGTVGVPVLFGRALFPRLTGLAPDKGCKGVNLDHLEQTLRIPCPEAETDIDSPGDLERL
ncbi:MAG: nucleotidyltransferase family protein [Pedosphaera sp.]|nr:nucleotidyltransferase family protein [Pedosphaera sp.]